MGEKKGESQPAKRPIQMFKVSYKFNDLQSNLRSVCYCN